MRSALGPKAAVRADMAVGRVRAGNGPLAADRRIDPPDLLHCRSTPATIMRCGPTLRLARTHPAHARSNGSGTLSRNRSLEGYTIDMRESDFSEGTRRKPLRCHWTTVAGLTNTITSM